MPWWGKIFLIYIRGDLFIILPVLILIFGISIFSVPYAIFSFGIFIAVRQAGEVVYWLLQQFGDKTYRPYDFGLTEIGNNAVYILYQTFAVTSVVFGILLSFYALR